MRAIDDARRTLGPEGERELRPVVARMAAASVLHGAAVVALVPVLERLFGPDPASAWPWIALFLLLAAAHLAVQARAQSAAFGAGVRAANALHHRIGDHVVRLPLAWFDATHRAELTAAAGGSVLASMGVPAYLLRPLITATVVPAVIAASLLVLDPALGVALLAGAASLHLLVEPGAWFLLCVVVVAAVLGTAALLRSLGVPRLLASAGGLVLLVLLLTLVFAARTAVLGVIPTPDTVRTLLAVGEQAGGEIYRRSAPVPPLASIVFVIVAAVGALAVVLDVLAHALRLPAVTGLPLLVLVSVPGAVLVGEFSIASFAVTALAWFAVLAADARESGREGGWSGSGLLGGSRLAPPPAPRRSSPVGPAGSARTTLASAGALAGGAVVLSLVAPAIVPGLTSATFPTASGSGQGGSRVVNPILDLGDDLRRPVDVEALRYSTASLTPLYFKVTTLSRFEGDEWAPSPLRPPDGNTVDEIGPDLGSGSDVPAEEVEARVQVEGSSSAWLPAPYAPRSVTGLEGSWRWSEQGLAIRSSDSDSRDQSYTVTSELPRPERAQLEAVAPATDDDLEPYLQIPDGTPAIVASTTADVLAGIDAPYDQALALQEFFTGGQFRYSEDAPVQQGYDGSGVDVVGEFLRVRSGYCVHFASAMAIMAREAGIPSRVAVGYLPGDQVGRDGDLITYRVGSHDLHSWPELYFSGIGWIAFEPTPGRGQAAPYDQASAAPTAAPTPSASPRMV
ncbi:transglutaminaseTgpA domain-containing protein, partial [Clavibacter michiganensis]|uniref:transglutaminaseTgpA domain-containing protein n=1 Tax=Clavibacter michiganensis TaxID=28447 RepID=UPI001F4DA5B2